MNDYILFIVLLTVLQLIVLKMWVIQIINLFQDIYNIILFSFIQIIVVLFWLKKM